MAVCSTGAGSARPVVSSITRWNVTRPLSRSRSSCSSASTRSPRSVQHRQPLGSSTMPSSIALDQQVVEADLAELVDDDGGVGERRVGDQAVEQRGLAGAEEAGQHGERERLGRARGGASARSSRRRGCGRLACRLSVVLARGSGASAWPASVARLLRRLSSARPSWPVLLGLRLRRVRCAVGLAAAGWPRRLSAPAVALRRLATGLLGGWPSASASAFTGSGRRACGRRRCRPPTGSPMTAVSCSSAAPLAFGPQARQEGRIGRIGAHVGGRRRRPRPRWPGACGACRTSRRADWAARR